MKALFVLVVVAVPLVCIATASGLVWLHDNKARVLRTVVALRPAGGAR